MTLETISPSVILQMRRQRPKAVSFWNEMEGMCVCVCTHVRRRRRGEEEGEEEEEET